MPKKFKAKIGARDIDILTALDRTPLTPAQLCRISSSFVAPFRDENNLRRRLRLLAQSDLVRSWPYAMATDGRSPRYFKLTREGFRLLYGADVSLPHRRHFEEIRHGHHWHTYCLAETIVHLVAEGSRKGTALQHFSRENSLALKTDNFTQYPDCAFELVAPDGRSFRFVVELDNGTERVRTKQDTESIERKVRGYDAHQAQYDKFSPQRYLVLFVTTRSERRLQHILDLASMVMRQPGRTVFLGVTLQSLLSNNPFVDNVFRDHRGLTRALIPHTALATETAPNAPRSVASVVA